MLWKLPRCLQHKWASPNAYRYSLELKWTDSTFTAEMLDVTGKYYFCFAVWLAELQVCECASSQTFALCISERFSVAADWWCFMGKDSDQQHSRAVCDVRVNPDHSVVHSRRDLQATRCHQQRLSWGLLWQWYLHCRSAGFVFACTLPVGDSPWLILTPVGVGIRETISDWC